VHGSGALIRWLLDREFVDEINLMISPVILGQGTRLFPTPVWIRCSNRWSRGRPAPA
jgi:dihydrofolate reductase